MVRFALILCAVLAPKALVSNGESEASKDLKEFARHPWGQYTVVLYGFPNDEPRWLRIQDRHGKVLKEIRGVGVGMMEDIKRPGKIEEIEVSGKIGEVKFLEMTGGGDPDLYIKTFGVGINCCQTEYYFTKDGGLRNLLIFFGKSRGIRELKDLNGDGRPEFIAEGEVSAYFGDLGRGDAPVVVMVIGWDGKKYRDQTRHYPTFARKEAQKYRDEFMRNPLGYPEGDRAAALGYYANSLVIGEGATARAWLLQHGSKQIQQWLFSRQGELRESLAELGRLVCVSQERILDFGDIGDMCPE